MSIESQERSDTEKAQSLLLLEKELARVGQKHKQMTSKNMWLSHHWPDDYDERCVRIGNSHICRRCAALYPLGIIIAFAAALGTPIWPDSWDPAAIWVLCAPATIAYVGEAIGLYSYKPKWQVAAMLVTSTAFGKALSYELQDRWSPEFWEPIAVFGGIWFLATVFSNSTK